MPISRSLQALNLLPLSKDRVQKEYIRISRTKRNSERILLKKIFQHTL